MSELCVLSVFLGLDGTGGNALGVFLDGAAIPRDARQDVAAALGFSETVFVDDRQRARLQIFTPATELALAGHPLVGTAYLLAEEGTPVDVLRPPAGEVATWREGESTFIRADPADAPPFVLHELEDPAAVEAATPPGDGAMVEVWAWIDEAAGVLRARVFPGGVGILEDEATGSAALLLCQALGRPIDIRQGHNSRILARPASHSGLVEVGGAVRLLERRAFTR
ncbi:MAG: PhzF family phenazine biosynthesis protein [Actinomycetota bacterium]|nr:PhzF family phenazine biosynthesis protein [Actinomycetota bacterium]